MSILEKQEKTKLPKQKEETILVIDDDTDCCLFIQKTLSIKGYRILLANSGREGLALVDKEKCDAVFLDISLPDIDGVDIANRIRQKKGNIPIIGITCTPIEMLRERYNNSLTNFTDICIKPFTHQVLNDVLQKFNFAKHDEQPESLQNIMEDYRASIPNRLELLQILIDEIRKKTTEKDLKELRLQVHKIAGSAGIYGYGEVSKICKELDQLLGQKIEQFDPTKDTSAWAHDFEVYLEKIRKGFSGSEEKVVSELKRKIMEKQAVIGVIGMGYIGLSLLDSFGAAGFSLVGYDINAEKVEMLKKNECYLNFQDMARLFSLMDQGRFKVSSNPKILENADVIIISVPTSIDRYGTPNLSNLRAAFNTVASNQKKQQLIVLQSSTYPGTTREELLPILSKNNLKVGIDFFLAHAPEIADIGNANFDFMKVPRIVSGITPACLKMVSLLYQFIGCKIVPCASTEVAEAAKLLQNAFRLVNISFINEMKILFDRMNIDVWEVIEAASSKPFGFMPFYPSPGIGGDCIPIAPFYLVWKAKVSGGPTTMLEDAGRINNAMPHYVIGKIIEGLNLRKKTIRDSKILVLGLGYKKDVNDVRESPALKILPLLKSMLADVYYHDPFVKEISGLPEYSDFYMKSINLDYDTLNLYDAVVVLTDHSFYDWMSIVQHSNLVIDTRNIAANIVDTKKIIKA
jgi:UDP-N-acetyl-D-glucosamine dehydrogenase